MPPKKHKGTKKITKVKPKRTAKAKSTKEVNGAKKFTVRG